MQFILVGQTTGDLMKEWSLTCFPKQWSRCMDIREVAVDGRRSKIAEARIAASVGKYSFQPRLLLDAVIRNAGSIEIGPANCRYYTGVLLESSQKKARIVFALLDIEGCGSDNDFPCGSDGCYSRLRSKPAAVARSPLAYLQRTPNHERWEASSSTSGSHRVRQSLFLNGIDRSG